MSFHLKLLENQSFLDSSGNDIVNIKSCTTDIKNNINYKVITYNKEYLSNDLIPVYGLYRSVILNDNNQLLSFSPPKSVDYQLFIDKYPQNEDVIASELIEGTMINVFWNKKIGLSGDWEIATKKIVGAETRFYATSPTFRAMFLEAAAYNNLNFELLNKNFCFSFILQHPHNKFVSRIIAPQLYLIAAYSIIYNLYLQKDVYVQSIDLSSIEPYLASQTTIQFPCIYKWESYKNLELEFGSQNTNYEIAGVMIHNRLTGERTKIRNPVYEDMRKLKGNQPILQYQYLTLRQQGKIAEFLTHYPENKKKFYNYRESLHKFTETLHKNYIICYVKKHKPLNEFGFQFRTHMFNLHQIYIDSLREKKEFLSKSMVIEYVNKLPCPLLMSNLNYQSSRKSIHDSI